MAACITVTGAGKFQVRPAANAGKHDALPATVRGWDRAVGFHTDFFLEHPGICSEQKPYVVRRGGHAGEERRRPLTNQEILTWAERHMVATRAHPNPARDFGKVCPEAPTVLRRAAINHAAGAVRAHRSNLANWEAADFGQRGQAPAPPRPHPHLVAYEGISTLRLEDYRKGFLRLNAASTVGAAWEGKRCIGIKTIRQARENEKREQALRTVAKKQRRSGRAVKGERSNRSLWNYIRNLDDALAWRIAARLVTWAVTLDLQVLVFEHLRPYRPGRGLSWSRRTNRKRSYRLRGKVVRYARHLALILGILVVERNPARTSLVCPKCHRLAERFSPGGTGYPGRLACGHCPAPGLAGLRHGDANGAAALNLKPKWDRTFRYPTKEEVKAAAEPRRAGNGGAAWRANGQTADALPASWVSVAPEPLDGAGALPAEAQGPGAARSSRHGVGLVLALRERCGGCPQRHHATPCGLPIRTGAPEDRPGNGPRAGAARTAVGPLPGLAGLRHGSC